MDTAVVEEASGYVIESLVLSLCLDGFVALLLLALKLFAFVGIVSLLSHNEEAHRSRKFVAIVPLLMLSTYALLTPFGSIRSMINGILVSVLFGSLFTKKICRIGIEKAFLANFFWCVLAVAMSMYAAMALDLLIHERDTISRTLASLIDDRTRERFGEYDLPESPGVVAAVLQSAASNTNETGIINTMMAPIRTGVKAKEKIAEVNVVAEEQAAVVNMLSGAGTNVGSRADELKALRSQLGEEAANGGTPPAASNAAHLPAKHIPETPPPPKPKPTPPQPPAKRGPPPDSPNTALGRAISRDIKSIASRISGRSDSPKAPANVDVEPNAGDEEDETGPANSQRRLWAAALKTIKTSGTMRTPRGAVVLVDGQFIAENSIHRFEYGGTNVAFRLIKIGKNETCTWEPVYEQPEKKDDDDSSTLVTF